MSSRKVLDSIVGGSAFLIIVIFVVYQIEIGNRNADELSKFGKYTTGELIKYGSAGRSDYGLTYRYYVDSVEYTKGTWANRWFKKCEKTGWCLGLKFRVKYSSVDPQNSIILLDEPVEEPDKTDGSNF